MALHKVGLQPWGRPQVFRDTHKRGGEESPHGFKEKMEPRLSFFECPDFQLMSQGPEPCSREKVFEFRYGRWHATHSLVATNAGKHDPIALRGQAHPDLRGSAAIVAKARHKTVARRFGRWFGRGPFCRILRTDIDVPAGAATPFFDFGEIGTLVPIGFGIVVH